MINVHGAATNTPAMAITFAAANVIGQVDASYDVSS